MDTCNCFLGQSQTFMGVLTTIIVLSIRRNDNNFVFQILEDIKNYIVLRVKEIKPVISYDRVKGSPAYKAMLLYIQTKENDNEELINQCKQGSLLVTKKELEAQNELTNWDNNVDQFAKDIYQNQEQQMAPMFIFAYCIIIFVFDEFLRYPDKNFTTQLSFGFILLSVMVFVFWLSKWIIFLTMESVPNDNKELRPDSNKHEGLWLKMKASNGIVKGFLCILIEIIILIIIQNFLNNWSILCFWITIIFIVCLSFIYTRVSAGGRKEKVTGGVSLHYVCQFFMMILLTVICIIELNIMESETIALYELCSEHWLFYAKILSFVIVICFGLLFPFLFPLLKYICLYIKAVYTINRSKVIVFCESHALNKKLEDLTKDIKVKE